MSVATHNWRRIDDSDYVEMRAMTPRREEDGEPDGVDMLDMGQREEENVLLLPMHEGEPGPKTEIDRWALACLLLQHVSK